MSPYPIPIPHDLVLLWLHRPPLKFEDIEKQRRFEEALLANVSAEEQEAKWEEAQKEAVSCSTAA